jgi:hypothetical protein
MAKPTRVPRWASVDGRVEPTAGEKDSGLAEGDGLPAEYLNDTLGLNGDWAGWLNDRLFDAYTLPTYSSDCRITGDPDEGMKVRNAAGDFLPVGCSKVMLDTDELEVVSGALEVRDSTTAYIPVACGNPAALTNALTRQYAEFFVRASDSGAQSISTEAQIVMNDAVDYARGMSLASNAFSVTASYGQGLYRVRALLKWAGTDTNAGYRTLSIRKNTTTIESRADYKPAVSAQYAQMLECLVEITDYQTDVIDLTGTSTVPSDGIGYVSIEIVKVSGPTT